MKNPLEKLYEPSTKINKSVTQYTGKAKALFRYVQGSKSPPCASKPYYFWPITLLFHYACQSRMTMGSHLHVPLISERIRSSRCRAPGLCDPVWFLSETPIPHPLSPFLPDNMLLFDWWVGSSKDNFKLISGLTCTYWMITLHRDLSDNNLTFLTNGVFANLTNLDTL